MTPSPMTTPVEDIEANYFALCLLMPENLLRTEVRKMGGIDLADDASVQRIADVFQVPLTAAAVRIGMLMATRGRK